MTLQSCHTFCKRVAGVPSGVKTQGFPRAASAYHHPIAACLFHELYSASDMYQHLHSQLPEWKHFFLPGKWSANQPAPPNPWDQVRPCTAIALAPLSSAILANSGATIESWFQPVLIFTVTGRSYFCTLLR